MIFTYFLKNYILGQEDPLYSLISNFVWRIRQIDEISLYRGFKEFCMVIDIRLLITRKVPISELLITVFYCMYIAHSHPERS